MTVQIMSYADRRVFDMTTNALLFGARAESKSLYADPERFDINVLIIGLSADMGKNHAFQILRREIPFNIQPINPTDFQPEALRDLILTLDSTSKQEWAKKLQTVMFNGHIILMDELNHANAEFILATAKIILDIVRYNKMSKSLLSPEVAKEVNPSLFVHCYGEALEKRIYRAMYEIWVEKYLRTTGDSVLEHTPLQYIKPVTLGHNFIDVLPNGVHVLDHRDYAKVCEVINGISVIEEPRDSIGYYVLIETSLTHLALDVLDSLLVQLRRADCTLIFTESFLERMYWEKHIRKLNVLPSVTRPPRIPEHNSITIESFLGID